MAAALANLGMDRAAELQHFSRLCGYVYATLAHAPRLSGPYWLETLHLSGGGWIVARTGGRIIALSSDGYTWTKVTPGR
jgi:hypothetical protein